VPNKAKPRNDSNDSNTKNPLINSEISGSPRFVFKAQFLSYKKTLNIQFNLMV